MNRALLLLAATLSSACAATQPAGPAPASAPASASASAPKSIPLPGVTGPAFLDYLAVDLPRGRVWVPVGNTGSVDVLDAKTATFTRVDGFKTAEREMRGKMRTVGPSAVWVEGDRAYVGNRATSEVCVVDAATLKLGKCLTLASPTDGVAYVASAKEVWVTTPRDQSLTVLDASSPGELEPKTVIKLGGDTEGYGVDLARGWFFTNLEDKGGTLVVDVKTHALKATWDPGCGQEGPRGLSVDSARGLVFVACADHVQVLDENHDGAKLGRFDAGAGTDNLDYLPSKGLLYVAAGKAAKLTVLHADDKGQLTLVTTYATSAGSRNAVVDANGTAYVADPQAAKLLVFPAP